jgi:hypothetical protein
MLIILFLPFMSAGFKRIPRGSRPGVPELALDPERVQQLDPVRKPGRWVCLCRRLRDSSLS